jgi:hypothetical protein
MQQMALRDLGKSGLAVSEVATSLRHLRSEVLPSGSGRSALRDSMRPHGRRSEQP